MTLTTEEFASGFHSLSGTTIGERRRHFYDLLKTASNVDLSQIEPKTPLEENFKVQALIYFRRVPELIDVLKSENPIFIKKLLKMDYWFWDSIFQYVSEKELIEQIFPCVSFNTKVKVINKLALFVNNDKRGDKIFETIKQRYNLYLAAKLLPCCSKNVILTSLYSSRIEVTSRQLLIIIKKYPDITESIFKALNQYRDKSCLTYKYKNVFKYLLNNNTLLFLKLYEEYEPSISLGGRATEKFVLKNKEDVINNASMFYKVLHNKRINKSLYSNFEKFYLNMFPKSLNAFKNDINFYINIMKHIPPSMSKINLIMKTFEQSYGDNIWDHCATPGLLELMSIKERETWMEDYSKPPHEMLEDVWICLMKTPFSIELLKTKIKQVTDAKERAQLICCMIENCRINDDKSSLNEVCKYVMAQHRNDTSSVLLSFLKTLKNCFDVDTLTDDHWKYINNIIQILIVRNELPFYYNDWLQSYVNYCFEKNLPAKETLIKLSKQVNSVIGWHQSMKEKHQKKCLITLGEILHEVCKDDKSNHYIVQFLHDIVLYNKKHPKDEISLFDYTDALTVFQQTLKGEDYVYCADVIVLYILQSKLVSKTEKMQWLELMFNKKNLYIAMPKLDWLIKYETDLISSCIEPATNIILNNWYTCITPFFWQYSRNYTHLEIPQKIVQICLNIINSEESDSKKKNAMTALSIILEPEEFLKIIVPYYPTESKMDVENKDQELYQMQQAITACLKYVIPPSMVLESISHFSKGDYLKYIQRALHSVSHNAAENNLISFYKGMIDRPVSVRKHAIYHTLKVLNWHEIKSMFETFMETEKNASILKIVFKGTFNYFVKNPNEYMWNLVKTNIKTVDVEDNEAWEILMNISKIPHQYLAQYLVFTFEIIETVPTGDNKLDEGKKKLINAITSDLIPQLPDEFCVGIIQKYFTKLDFQDTIFSFACMYIIYADDNLQNDRVNTIFNIVIERVISDRHNSDNQIKGRKLIYNFIQKFCSYFLDKKVSSKSILIQFMNLWNNLLKPHDAFNEYLLLEFTSIYVDFVNHKWDYSKLGDELGKLSTSLFNVYGLSIVNLFGEQLNSFIKHFLDGTDDILELNRLKLIENIVVHKDNLHFLLIAICLLSKNVSSVPHVKLAYNQIIYTLESCDDPIVKFSLSSHYNALKVPTKENENEYKKKIKYKSRRGLFSFVEEYSNKYEK